MSLQSILSQTRLKLYYQSTYKTIPYLFKYFIYDSKVMLRSKKKKKIKKYSLHRLVLDHVKNVSFRMKPSILY